jgi:hypothetical protein
MKFGVLLNFFNFRRGIYEMKQLHEAEIRFENEGKLIIITNTMH